MSSPRPLPSLDQLQPVRKVYAHLSGDLDRNRLWKIPDGFSNSVGWNVAHAVVTQQLLSYGLSGIEPLASKQLIERYRKGTAPDGSPDDEGWAETQDLLHTSAVRLKEDYAAGRFENFNEYKTSAGVVLASIEDAICFNLFHEGLHIGSIMALRKQI